MRYPRIVKNGYAWLLRNLYKDPMWAELVAGCSTKSVDEEWHLTVRRDIYRKKFHDAWDEAGFDLLLTVPNAIPAIPKDGMEEATVANCSYVFLFNVVSQISVSKLIFTGLITALYLSSTTQLVYFQLHSLILQKTLCRPTS